MARKLINKDINPQFFRLFVLQSAANTFTESSAATPNLTEAGFVMELLRVYWEVEGVVDFTADDKFEFALYDSEKTVIPHYNDAGVFCKKLFSSSLLTSGASAIMLSGEVDYTDGDGNGLLFARKNMFVGAVGASQTIALQVNVAVLYRLKKVSPGELVGLMSS